MADKKKMSVEEILAACRNADGSGGSPPAATPAAESAASGEELLAKSPRPAAKPAPAKPSAGGPAKKPGDMSVADILAAARAEKGAGGAKPAAPKPAPAAKPVDKPAAAKAASAKGAASASQAPAAAEMDTSSILAAARKAVKPGPVSKAEAPIRAAGAPKATPVVPPFPEKPAYAKPATGTKPAAKETRRAFFGFLLGSGLAVGFTSLATACGLYTLGLARFMFPNIRTEPPSRFKVGFPANFAPGAVSTQFTSQFGVWIVNAEYDGQPIIVALRTVCTHLGCTPSWLEGEQKFKCPCHGSGFYKDGINFEGPAPRPLERYAIRIADDGQLEVDKSQMFQQEMGQWKDPASFVPV